VTAQSRCYLSIAEMQSAHLLSCTVPLCLIVLPRFFLIPPLFMCLLWISTHLTLCFHLSDEKLQRLFWAFNCVTVIFSLSHNLSGVKQEPLK